MKHKIGCLARFSYYPYEHDVEFARKYGFDFLQIHYDNKGLLQKEALAQAKVIKNIGFPGIIHALLDINEIEEHTLKLCEVLNYLEHNELIIHPICRSEEITGNSIYKLSKKVSFALSELRKENITLYLENNSKLDPIFTSSKEIMIMFKENPDLEFVLDIAHIDDYMHLGEMVNVKFPKLLHITDRRLEEVHNHVPIGKGNIDFKYIFGDILTGFNGKAIIEIYPNDDDIVYAKHYIEKML